MVKIRIKILAFGYVLFAAAVSCAAELRGVYPILSVPYEENGALDVGTLVKEARFVVDAGVEGFIWAQSNDAIDLLTIQEKKDSFRALAAAFAGEDVIVTLGCQGRDTAAMAELARYVEELALEYPSTRLAIACRPPHDARSQEDIERYYRTLAGIAKRPVIIQTYTSEVVPIPSSDLLIRLSREFPGVYGWIKEETGGADANERMRKQCGAKGVKTVFSAWGSYGWIDQYCNYGTRGLVSERAGYADYLMRIWAGLEEWRQFKEKGDNVYADELRARIDDLWATYLFMMNLKETIPGGHLRGFNLYILKKRGIFKNLVSRDYAAKDDISGRWKLSRLELAASEISEIEERWKRMREKMPERTFVSRIKLLDGERWYGGAVNLGAEQPWTDKSETFDARYGRWDYDLSSSCWGGGVMPFLVSDKGRYVWGEKPFKFRFSKGILRLESDFEKLKVSAVGKTLREAYLKASRAHFPFSGKIPPEEFFDKPQFNNWVEIFLRGVTQKNCEDYVREVAQSGFPCGVFMTDGGWMKYHGAELFDDMKFPEPKKYFALIRAQGWKSLLWMSPFVSPDSQKEYRALRYYPYAGLPGSGYEKGRNFLIRRRKSNAAAIIRWWSGCSAAYDLTDPAAFEYYVERKIGRAHV